jgi:hypothetical protein
MKNVVQKSLLGWKGRVGVTVLAAACSVALLAPTNATAAGKSVSQLKYLQTLVQLTGDSGLFTAGAKTSDYVQWAKNRGLEPAGGWKGSASLSSDVLAETLVQLYGLNPRKYGGDNYRNLERNSIVLERGSTITVDDLAALIDNPAVTSPLLARVIQPTSPNKPGNGQGFGLGLGNNPNGIPGPPPGNPPPNPANPKRTGNPHLPRP